VVISAATFQLLGSFFPLWTGRAHLTQVTLPRLPRRQAAEMAGQRALQRSAKLDAIRYFSEGLEVLKTLPDTPARTQ
jgi:hypothetical protein